MLIGDFGDPAENFSFSEVARIMSECRTFNKLMIVIWVCFQTIWLYISGELNKLETKQNWLGQLSFLMKVCVFYPKAWDSCVVCSYLFCGWGNKLENLWLFVHLMNSEFRFQMPSLTCWKSLTTVCFQFYRCWNIRLYMLNTSFWVRVYLPEWKQSQMF